MIWLERRYQPILSKVLGFPKTIIVLTLSLFVLAIFILTSLGGEFIPQLEEGDFAVETRLLTGSNLNNTIATTQKAAGILLREFPEVQKIVTKIGSAEIPTDPMPFEAGDMMVILKDKKDWTSATTFPELSAKMTKALEVVPGITVGFQFPVQMRFNELMTGARQDVVCKIFGEDLDSLSKYAHQLTGIIQKVKGAVNIYEEQVNGMPQVVVKYNRDGMAKYGLNVNDINRVVNTAFAGQVAGQVYEGEKRFDMVVRLEGDSRKNIQDIKNLMVPTKMGLQIPLSLVAEVNEVEGVNQIQRENTKRRIIIGFNIKDRDVQSIVTELQQKVATDLPLQKGYTIQYGGSFENMTGAKARLSIVVPIALFLIFLLLYFAFNSVKQGLLIYTAIPLSAIGGILALWIRDLPFSISAGVGFIALFGVAVLNGILLVTEFNRLKSEGWKDVKRIVIHGTKSKLRAVLMTALVPSLGFIPMAISTGAGGAVQKPLATVVIGGLIISTLLTLFVLPMLYIVFEKGFGYFKPKKAIALTAVMLLLGLLNVNAQQKITLPAAMDTALKNNAGLHVAMIQTDYQRELKKTSFDVQKMAVGYEYGKINSLSNDNLFSVSQSFEFPSVYIRQSAIYKTNIELSEINLQQKQLDLRTKVKSIYYGLLVLQNKHQLLVTADSIYTAFLEKAEQRFTAGDVDVLELATAKNQRLQITNQLLALNTDYEILLNRFNILLNSQIKYTPGSRDVIYQFKVMPNDNKIDQNLTLQFQEQEIKLSKQQHQLEKSKLLPGLNIGYSNTSIIGWQTNNAGNNVYFDQNKRFSSVSVGLGIPLFFGAQRARIRASNIMVKQKEQEFDQARQLIHGELEDANRSYKQYSQLLNSYQDAVLPNTSIIINTTTAKLDAGAIGYLDWVILINQSIQVRAEYLTTVQQLNEAAFALERISTFN